jgi:hypothetical protein
MRKLIYCSQGSILNHRNLIRFSFQINGLGEFGRGCVGAQV